MEHISLPKCPVCEEEVSSLCARENRIGDLEFFCCPCECQIDEEDYYQLLDEIRWCDLEFDTADDEEDEEEDNKFGYDGDWWQG